MSMSACDKGVERSEWLERGFIWCQCGGVGLIGGDVSVEAVAKMTYEVKGCLWQCVTIRLFVNCDTEVCIFVVYIECCPIHCIRYGTVAVGMP